MYCPNCNQFVDTDEDKCPKCGSKLIDMKEIKSQTDEENKKEDVVEINKKYGIGLLFAMPSRGMVDVRQITRVRQILDHMPTGITYQLVTPRGYPVDEARTKAAERALELNAKWLLFVDDDCFPPIKVVPKLMKHNKKVISGIVWTKDVPTEPCIYKDYEAGPYFDFPVDRPFRIQSAGLSCTLINVDVFREMEKPWFKTGWQSKDKNSGQTANHKVGEDLYFYSKLDEMDIQAWCDPHVMADHLDTETGKFYPGSDPDEKKVIEKKLEKMQQQQNEEFNNEFEEAFNELEDNSNLFQNSETTIDEGDMKK